MPLAQDLDALDAGHARQPDVRKHDVREVATDLVQGLFHRPEYSGAPEALRAVDQDLQALPEPGEVLDNGDLDGRLVRLGIFRLRHEWLPKPWRILQRRTGRVTRYLAS